MIVAHLLTHFTDDENKDMVSMEESICSSSRRSMEHIESPFVVAICSCLSYATVIVC
jgi:hypothetical protein